MSGLPASSVGALWAEGRGSWEGREDGHSQSQKEGAANLLSHMYIDSLTCTTLSHLIPVAALLVSSN